MTWSDALYPATLQWANACKFQHRLVRETLVTGSTLICGYSQPGGKYGENLVRNLVLCSFPRYNLGRIQYAASGSGVTFAQSIDGWMSESGV